MIQLECEAILFDLDGVFIDSTSCIARHWQKWAARHGLEMDAVMQVAHGLRTVETMRLVAPHLDAEMEAERFTAFEVVDTEGVVAIEGASQTLKGLPKGAWTIVTSAGHDLARARLAHAGLPVPDIFVSGDDVKRGKSAPDPYLVGAKRLGKAAERCVAIEDAPAGIEAARAAGMRVIGVTTTHRREELECEVIVEQLSELRVLEGEAEHLLLQIDRES